MARRYYRSRVRYIKPKKRWASNIGKSTYRFITTLPSNAPSGQVYTSGTAAVLVQNSAQVSNPTPTIVKTGNFKVQGNFNQFSNSTTAGSSFGCTLYIMYVPQGYDISNNSVLASLVADHPEWIMAWSLLDTDSIQTTTGNLTKFSCSSRLKRNLNSGDRVCAIFISRISYLGEGTPGSEISIALSGDIECHYWTCAN